MGHVFKKTITRLLPPGAEIITRKGERLARWRDRKGKQRTASVTAGRDGSVRIREGSRTYHARYLAQELRDPAAVVTLVSESDRPTPAIRGRMMAACRGSWRPMPTRPGTDPPRDGAPRFDGFDLPTRTRTDAYQKGRVDLRRWWSDILAVNDDPAKHTVAEVLM